MITDAIISILLSPFTFVLSAIPTVTWPGWMSLAGGPGTLLGAVQGFAPSLHSFDSWFPTDSFMTAGELVLIGNVGAAAIRGVRVLVSMFTGGGGAVS